MHFDIGTRSPLTPTPAAFTCERDGRGARYEENKYFSQAPLRTGDHKAVLTELEKILLAWLFTGHDTKGPAALSYQRDVGARLNQDSNENSG